MCWVCLVLVLFDNKEGFTSAIPTVPSDGYPGTYVPIGAVGAIAINAGGTGYSDATNVATTGGTGSGLTVDITVTAGVITNIEIAKMGEDYTDGDTITVTGGGGNATATITLAEPNLLCLLYTSPSPRDRTRSRMPSSA